MAFPTEGSENVGLPRPLPYPAAFLWATWVAVCGLATDYCVKETAIDATRLGWDTTVVTEAIRAVNLEEGDDERARAEMRSAGVVLE